MLSSFGHSQQIMFLIQKSRIVCDYFYLETGCGMSFLKEYLKNLVNIIINFCSSSN